MLLLQFQISIAENKHSKSMYKEDCLSLLHFISLGWAIDYELQQCLVSVLYYMLSYTAHKKGKAGGGWASDEEEEEELPPLSPPSPQPPYHDFSLGTSREEDHSKQKGLEEGWGPEEEFLATRLDPNSSWPMDHDILVSLCRDCSALNPERLLGKVGARLMGLLESEDGIQCPSGSQTTLANVSVHNQDLGMSVVPEQDSSLPKDLDALSSSTLGMTASVSLTPGDTTGTLQASFTHPTTSVTPFTTHISNDTCTASDLKTADNSLSCKDSVTPPMTSRSQAASLHHFDTSSPTTHSLVSSQHSILTPSQTSVRLLVLLLLVEFGLHYEVFSPAVINSTLGVALTKVHKEGAEAIVKTKARKLSLIVAKLM